MKGLVAVFGVLVFGGLCAEPFKVVVEDVPLQDILNAGVELDAEPVVTPQVPVKPVEPIAPVKPLVDPQPPVKPATPVQAPMAQPQPIPQPVSVPAVVPPQVVKPVEKTPVVAPVKQVPFEQTRTPVFEKKDPVALPSTPKVEAPKVVAPASLKEEVVREAPNVVSPEEIAAQAKPEEVTSQPVMTNIPQAPVANCAHALNPPEGFSREVLMLQIFLDRNNFSAGVIDGYWGVSSQKAMAAYQKAKGLRQTTWIDVPLYAEIATVESALQQYVIAAEDVALVTGIAPSTWAERAKMKLMGYETLGACIAERFHTSERTLRNLNPNVVNWPADLSEGTILTVPNVNMMALPMVTRVVIVLDECLLLGFSKNADGTEDLALRFPCSIARARAHRPDAGSLAVTTMAPAPNYTYDPQNYNQDTTEGRAVVPPGPRNPVGSRWIGLSLPSYGIHGTPRPNTVGRPESRGCFRLTNWNVEKLFDVVETGTPVEVVETLSEAF